MQRNKDAQTSLHYLCILCTNWLKQAITSPSPVNKGFILGKIMHLAESVLAFWAFLGNLSARTTG
jgi:hypothetical protein